MPASATTPTTTQSTTLLSSPVRGLTEVPAAVRPSPANAQTGRTVRHRIMQRSIAISLFFITIHPSFRLMMIILYHMTDGISTENYAAQPYSLPPDMKISPPVAGRSPVYVFVKAPVSLCSASPPEGGDVSFPVHPEYYMMMASFGQAPWQVPQATQRSSSRTQVFALRSTVSAPAGQLRAQSVQ